MNKIRLAAAASIAVVVALLSPGAAQAYPDSPNITITIPDAVLFGGDTFSFTASANNASVNCAWTVTYNDTASGVSHTQTGSGQSISGSYKTKKVDDIFRSSITATCVYDDNVPAVSATVVGSNEVTPAFYSADSGSVLQAAQQTAQASAVVTLLPRDGSDDGDDDSDSNDSGDSDNGILPNTGGTSFWILLLGAGLVVVGGGLTYATRRRHTSR